MKYRIFKQIMTSGNFTKAAEALNMTQSAVSHAVSALEREIGFTLFVRTKQGIRLTEDGKQLWHHVETLVAAEDRLYNQIHAMNRLEMGTLRVGSFTSASSRFLPKILKAYDARYPDVQVEIFDEDYDRIMEKLHQGRIDVGFLIEDYIKKEHHSLPCFKDEMVVVVPYDMDLSQIDDIALKDVEKYPFIMPDNNQDVYLKQLLAEHHVLPRIKYKFQLMSTVFAMVEAGLGITIVPDSTLLKTNYNVDLISLDPPVYRNIHIVANKTQMHSPVVKSFFEVAKSIK